MKKGEKVQIIQPVLKGVINKVEWDEEADEKRFRVDFSESEGKISERWLTESQVEPVQ